MEFPESVLRAVETAAAQHPDDIPQAVECAVRAVLELPDFKEIATNLWLTSAVQDLVYEARHRTNRNLRSNGGDGPKVAPLTDEVNQAYESCYQYRIAGMTLGNVKGADLPGIAEHERAVADGHRFNAELCEHLARLVGEEQRVSEAVPEPKLRALFKRLKKKQVAAA